MDKHLFIVFAHRCSAVTKDESIPHSFRSSMSSTHGTGMYLEDNWKLYKLGDISKWWWGSITRVRVSTIRRRCWRVATTIVVSLLVIVAPSLPLSQFRVSLRVRSSYYSTSLTGREDVDPSAEQSSYEQNPLQCNCYWRHFIEVIKVSRWSAG